MQKAADEVRGAFGRADILVNSAGFTKPVPHGNLEALDDALLDRMLIANVRGPFAMIRAFAPLLRESGDGVVVNVSSIAGFTGSGSSIAYCGAKAAVDNMTIALARVLGPQIRLLCVSPGAVNTDFVAGRDHAQLEKLAQATPLKRVVEPDDVARAIMALRALSQDQHRREDRVRRRPLPGVIMATNETHDPARRSFVESANDGSDFPIQNLPFGVFRRRGGSEVAARWYCDRRSDFGRRRHRALVHWRGGPGGCGLREPAAQRFDGAGAEGVVGSARAGFALAFDRGSRASRHDG